MQIAQQEAAATCCLRSSSNCWVKEEWEWWIRVEQWSAVAIIITNTTLQTTPILHLLQPAKRNCPVCQILHPALHQLPSLHLKIALLPLHLSPHPQVIRPPVWENARGLLARGLTVPCPLSPLPCNAHLTRLPKRVAKKESKRMNGRYKSWQSRMSVWKQRLKGWERKSRGHVELWLRGWSTPGNEGKRDRNK